MFKKYDKYLAVLFLIGDSLAIFLAYYLAYVCRFYLLKDSVFFKGIIHYLKFTYIVRELSYVIPIYIFIFYISGLYNINRTKKKFFMFYNIISSNILGMMTFMFVLYFTRNIHISRKFLVLFFVFTIIIQYIYRVIVYMIISKIRKNDHNLQHIIVIGYSKSCRRYIDIMSNSRELGYEIYGIIDDNLKAPFYYREIPYIGTIDELENLLSENKFDEVIITLSLSEYKKLKRVVKICEKSGIHTKFIPDYTDVIPTVPYIEDVEGLPMINIRRVPLTDEFNKSIKRAVDIFGSIVAIIVFCIPMLVVAIIIKLTSKGPLIYAQERVGLHNEIFKMYKFRSMVVQNPNEEKKGWTTKNDSRITPIGRFIRKTSIDELPQIFNVLKGDMSLIGPRPERPQFVEKFKEEIPRYMIKHQVRPGITGWAQINGYRGDTSIITRIEYDLYYIENWSLLLDFKIIILTFFKGFINKNAY